MRIISDFHDYYDIGMQNGVDVKLPYRRFTREESIHITIPGRSWRSSDGYSRDYIVLFFGFAGGIYPAIVQAKSSDEYLIYYDLAELDKVHYDEQIYNEREEKHRIVWRKPRRDKERKECLAEIKEDLDDIWGFRDRKELRCLFEQFKTAIFVHRMGSDRVVINERLNQYGFQKVLPPMQAFQELEMYVGSYLTQPVIEEPPISDKIKAEIHGFDKYSFRKDKKQL